jgi:hypothetical protein
MPSGKTMPMRPPGLSHLTQRSMNSTSGDDAGLMAPVMTKAIALRSQRRASSYCSRMVGSVTGMSEPNGGLVDDIHRAELRDLLGLGTPGRCPTGNSSEFM